MVGGDFEVLVVMEGGDFWSSPLSNAMYMLAGSTVTGWLALLVMTTEKVNSNCKGCVWWW